MLETISDYRLLQKFRFEEKELAEILVEFRQNYLAVLLIEGG